MAWTVSTPVNADDPLPRASFSNPNVTTSHPCPPCSGGSMPPRYPRSASFERIASGTLWSRSHCSANGSTSSATKAANSLRRASCASLSGARIGAPPARDPSSVLPQHESGRGVDRLEILDIQIVHGDFDGERPLDERHQLHGEQRVDDSRFE